MGMGGPTIAANRVARLPSSSEAIAGFLNEADSGERYDHEITHVPTGQATEALQRRDKADRPTDAREFYRSGLHKLENLGHVRRRGKRVSITPTGR